MLELTDTHCHIQTDDYGLNPDQVIKDGAEAGVTRAICVGEDIKTSQEAINFVSSRENLWASVGVHPHNAASYLETETPRLQELVSEHKVVAIGECGLDYYYNHSLPEQQKQVLIEQLELASKHNLPLIFHVRSAFSDFWPIFDSFKGLSGVVHSFSSNRADLEQILKRDLYVGLNGIMTFTRDEEQLAAAKAVPLSKMLLETDAPYLTPAPYRGRICEIKHIRVIAEFLANLRGDGLSTLAEASTNNALKLFDL